MTDPSIGAEFELAGRSHRASDSLSRDGDRAWLASFFDRHAAFAYSRALFAMRGDKGLAEDLVQETMIRIYQMQDKGILDDPGSARSYLSKMIQTRAIDWWRRERVQPVSLDELATYQDLQGDSLSSGADIAEARDLLDRVESQLPARQREVLARVVEGYSHAEIAQELNISPAAVRSILKRSRENVKILMNDLEAETEHDLNTELIAENVLSQQVAEEFWKILDRELTHTEFRVAYLSWYADKSPQEIAKTLGTTVRAIRRYRVNARRKITGMIARHEIAVAA